MVALKAGGGRRDSTHVQVMPVLKRASNPVYRPRSHVRDHRSQIHHSNNTASLTLGLPFFLAQTNYGAAARAATVAMHYEHYIGLRIEEREQDVLPQVSNIVAQGDISVADAWQGHGLDGMTSFFKIWDQVRVTSAGMEGSRD